MKTLSAIYKLILYSFIIIALYTEIFANGNFRLGACAYFTIQSNMLVSFCLLLSVIWPGYYRVKYLIIGTTLLSIIITGIVYNFVLYKIFLDWGTSGYSFSRTILHVISPIGFIIGWLLFDDHGHMKWKDLFIWFAYPFVYCVGSVFAAVAMNFSIYSFFNISAGYMSLLKWICIFLCLSSFIGLVIIFADKNLRYDKTRSIN